MFGHLWAHGYFFAGHALFSFEQDFFILYVWDPSGAIPKWFPCNTAGTGGGDSGAYWPRTISKGERYPQILHQKSHAVWAESGMPLHSVWRSFKNSSFSLKILHLWGYCIKGQLDSMFCLKPISYWVSVKLLQDSDQLEYLRPKKTSLAHRLPMGDQGFVEFVAYLLQVDPTIRPSATEALQHPWLSYPYEPISSWRLFIPTFSFIL